MAEYMPPEVLAVIGVVDTYIKWENTNDAPRGHERYHPSAFGKCLRLMQYQRYAERGYIEAKKENYDAPLLRVFQNGHSMHDRWRGYFEGLGVLKGYWKCTNPYCASIDDNGNQLPNTAIKTMMEDPGSWLKKRRVYGTDSLQGCFKPKKCKCGWNKFHYDELDVVDKDLNFYGHADMILDFSNFDPESLSGTKRGYKLEDLPKTPVVVDMKSINHFDFQNVAKGESHDYYETQLTVYANVLDCEYGILIYENKNNQKTSAFRINRNADTLWPQIQNQAKMMCEMAEVIDEEGNVHHLLPPPRPAFKDEKECEWCSYKDLCHESSIWDDPELREKRKEFYGEML